MRKVTTLSVGGWQNSYVVVVLPDTFRGMGTRRPNSSLTTQGLDERLKMDEEVLTVNDGTPKSLGWENPERGKLNPAVNHCKTNSHVFCIDKEDKRRLCPWQRSRIR